VFTAWFELGVPIHFCLFSGFTDLAISREVSRKPFMLKGWARTQGSLCGMCGVKRDIGAGHSPNTSAAARLYRVTLDP
jgi:hypothetical protein